MQEGHTRQMLKKWYHFGELDENKKETSDFDWRFKPIVYVIVLYEIRKISERNSDSDFQHHRCYNAVNYINI